MSIRHPSSFGVGEVLCSTEFRITPQDVAAWERAQVLGDRDDRPGFRSRLECPPVAGSPVPDALVLARAIEAIERAGNRGGCRFELTSIGKLRTLARVSVGEPLSAIATIRFRSQRDDLSESPRSPADAVPSREGQADHTFLTLTVEIRGDGRKLAEVDFGVEVIAPPQAVVVERLWARAA